MVKILNKKELKELREVNTEIKMIKKELSENEKETNHLIKSLVSSIERKYILLGEFIPGS